MIDIDSLYPVIANDLASQVNNIDYLLHIEGVAYVATRKQMFEADGQEVYFEDLDLKVSSIKEKIDIKDKKIYLSNTSITMSNFPILQSETSAQKERISDRISQGYGKVISVYFKTQSCKNINECLKIADLSIIKVTHDGDKIKIDAEDRNQQAFYVNLPRQGNVLEKDINTFSSYDQKPIPILYGHLQDAPAVVYVNEMQLTSSNMYDNNNISLLPDNSFISQGISNIQGIKDYGQSILSADSDSLQEDYKNRTKSYLENDNIVKMKIDDIMCSVNRYPYYNIRDFKEKSIAAFHNYPQFEVLTDHIQLNTRYNGEPTILKNGGIWTHTFSPFMSKEGIYLRGILERDIFAGIVTTTEETIKYQAFSPNIQGNKLIYPNSIFTDFTNIEELENGFGLSIDRMTGICVEKLEFEAAPSMNFLKKPNGNDYPKDMNFTGSINLNLQSSDIHENQKLDIFCVPSGYRLDETDFGDDETINDSGLNGFPSEFGDDLESCPENLTGFIMDEDFTDIDIDDFFFEGFEGLDKYINFIFSLSSPFYTSLSLSGSSTSRFISYLYPQYGLDGSGLQAGRFQEHENIFKNYERSADEFLNEAELEGVENSGLTTNANFPIETASELTFYYKFNPDTNSNGIDNTLTTELSNINMRRFWCEAEAFNKEYFLDCRGRTDLKVYETRNMEGVPSLELIDRVTGVIRIVFINDTVSFSNDGDSYDYNHNNNHYLELIEKLKNNTFKTKIINGESYEIMMMTRNSIGEESFLYDIEINDIYPLNGINTPALYWENFDNVSADNGWDVNFKANRFGFNGDVNINVSVINDEFFGRFDGIKLVYGKKVFNYNLDEVDAKEIISIEVALDEDSLELQTFNDTNGYNGVDTLDPDLRTASGLSAAIWNSAYHKQLNQYGNMLENPVEISKNLIKTEMNNTVVFEESKFKEAQEINNSIRQAFSVNERLNSREILENIYRHSRSFFNYRPRDGKAIVNTILNNYSSSDKTINSDSILKFSYTKTSLKDICGAGCIVKYGYDYGKEELAKTTMKRAVYSSDSTPYKNYYSINEDDFDNYILEFEAPYIQDEASANYLRNFLFQTNLHQHLIIKLKLDIKDGLGLETGDIVKFDKDPNNVKPYGKSLIIEHEIPLQKILPFFMITSISKGSNSVDLEVYQLHTIDMTSGVAILPGDINADGQVDGDDLNMMSNYINNPNPFSLTEEQFLNGDINGDGVIDEIDLLQLTQLDNYTIPNEPPIADILLFSGLEENEDGQLVLDIYNLENYEDGSYNSALAVWFFGANNTDIDGEISGYSWSITQEGRSTVSLEELNQDSVNVRYLKLRHSDDQNYLEIGEEGGGIAAFYYLDLKGNNSQINGITVSLNVYDDEGAISEEPDEIFFTPQVITIPDVPVFSSFSLQEGNPQNFIENVSFTQSNENVFISSIIEDSDIQSFLLDVIGSTFFSFGADFTYTPQTYQNYLRYEFYDTNDNFLNVGEGRSIDAFGTVLRIDAEKIFDAMENITDDSAQDARVVCRVYSSDSSASLQNEILGAVITFDLPNSYDYLSGDSDSGANI